MTQISSHDNAHAIAIGFAQRKSNVFFAWFAPLTLALAGALYAVPALMTNDGKDSETGLLMMAMGLVFSGIGWLLSAPKRFTKKKPTPAKYLDRVEKAIRQHRRGQIARLVLVLVISGMILFLTPKGLTQDGISVTGILIGVYIPIAVGLEYWYRLIANCESYYSLWVQKIQ